MRKQYYTSRSALASFHSFGSIEIDLCLQQIAVKSAIRTLYEGAYTNSLVVGCSEDTAQRPSERRTSGPCC